MRITVNDDPIPFFMKVGETGEAFFVFETDADLPESMQTSPLAGPVADDEAESPGVSPLWGPSCKLTLHRSPSSWTWAPPRRRQCPTTRRRASPVRAALRGPIR